MIEIKNILGTVRNTCNQIQGATEMKPLSVRTIRGAPNSTSVSVEGEGFSLSVQTVVGAMPARSVKVLIPLISGHQFEQGNKMKTTLEILDTTPVSVAAEIQRAARENSVPGYAFAGGYIAASFEWDHLDQQDLVTLCDLLCRLPQSPLVREEVLAWTYPTDNQGC